MHLDWRDQANKAHKLNIRFSRSDVFFDAGQNTRGYSWVFDEKTLLSHFPEYQAHGVPTGQFYYSLNVTEITNKEGTQQEVETDLFDIWLSNDGNYGELHNVHRGKKMSGNDVLDVYKFFDGLFQVKKTFFCDVSSLNNNNFSIQIPLRLILAIMHSKTWYQSKLAKVSLFECFNFPTIANGYITQNNENYLQALTELQQMSLLTWYGMLAADDQAQLIEIYSDCYPGSINYSRFSSRNRKKEFDHAMQLLSKMTLQDFVTALYNASKNSGSISHGMMVLTKLLCGTVDPDSLPYKFDVNASDYWVKSRVEILLQKSLFWVKEHDDSQDNAMIL
jgi:hypothetical protein